MEVMPSPPGVKGRAVGIVEGMDCTVGAGGLTGSGISWSGTCSVGAEATGLLAGGSGLGEAELGPKGTKQASGGASGLLCRAVFLAGAGGMTRQGISASPVGVSGRLGHFPAGGWALLSSASAWRCCLRRRYSDRLRGRGLASWVVALVPFSTFREPTTSLISGIAFGGSEDSDSRRTWGAGLPWADDTAPRLGSVGLDLISTGSTGARSTGTESTGAGLTGTGSTGGKSSKMGTTTAGSIAAESARTGSISTGSAGRGSTSSELTETRSTNAGSTATGSARPGSTAVGSASTESSGMGSAQGESTNERWAGTGLAWMVSTRLGWRSRGPSSAGLACPTLLSKFPELGFSKAAAQARAQARGFPLPRGGSTSL